MSGLGAYFILGSGVNIAVFSALLRWTPVLDELRRSSVGKLIPANVDPAGIAGVSLIMGILLALLGGVWLARLGQRARQTALDNEEKSSSASSQAVKALFYAILSFAFFPVPLLLRILQTAEQPDLMARLGLEGLRHLEGVWSLLKIAPAVSLAGLFLLIWCAAWLLLRWAHTAPQRPLQTASDQQ